MSFVLEATKNGKDCILFNNYKYRESYTIKCGDIVWRCLGKSCKASVKTDKDKTAIYFCNEEHSGQHPVTMRAMTPTPPQQCLRPVSHTPTTPVHATPMLTISPTSSVTMSSPVHNEVTKPVALLQTASSQTKVLQTENNALKLEMEVLREEMRIILDHSIESDQRLLQFTEEVFLPPGMSSMTGLSSPSGHVPSTRDSAIQCDLLDACDDGGCSATHDLICSLRTTISVLEAEVQLLRTETLQERYDGCDEASKLHNSDETSTKIDVITKLDDEGFTTVTKRKFRNRRKQLNNVSNLQQYIGKQKPTHYQVSDEPFSIPTIPFKNITVLGDSHVRNLASVMRSNVKEDIFVSGVCKPGAGLLSMVPTNEPPRDHCYILMAGTNDVDVGREDVIFERLEEVLNSYKKSPSLLLVPLTKRHDLPYDSPIHQTVNQVNDYMAQLCHRHEGVELLDIGSISRRHFTRHGLHLRGSGKRVLARLVVRRLSAMSGGPCPHGAEEVKTGDILASPASRLARMTYSAVVAGSPNEAWQGKCQVFDYPSNQIFLEKVKLINQVK